MKKDKGISLVIIILIVVVVIIFFTIVIISLNNKKGTTSEIDNKSKFASNIAEVQQAVAAHRVQNQFQSSNNKIDINDGFKRVVVTNEPDNFVSFPLETGETVATKGYLVNLDTINMKTLTLGQGYKSVTEVKFDDTDAFVYDAKGEVYYAKGFKENNASYYTLVDTAIINESLIEVPNNNLNTTISKGVNSPVLGTGMIEVYWDNSGREIKKGDARFNINNWYDYIIQTGGTEAGGTSKWANAKTADGSYFVWIPRFAYKITYFTDLAKTTTSGTRSSFGEIDVLFLEGTSNDKYYEKDTNIIKELPAGYIVHPAFTTNVSSGGWSKELTGIWVAKYETSRSDATNISTGTSNIAKSIPGVRKWDNIKIGDAFLRGQNYNTTLNSHLMKNSEWGATAFLAYSEYGRNGTEITINNNSNKLTGYAGGIVDAAPSTSSTFEYNTKEGLLSSTTGNMSGIYDMSGGGYEYVSAYNAENQNNILSEYGSSFIFNKDSTTINKEGSNLATAYSGVNESTDFIIGDATYETKNWNNDSNEFLTSKAPYFLRGGSYINKENAGIFFYYSEIGDALSNYCFRICLAPG